MGQEPREALLPCDLGADRQEQFHSLVVEQVPLERIAEPTTPAAVVRDGSFDIEAFEDVEGSLYRSEGTVPAVWASLEAIRKQAQKR